MNSERPTPLRSVVWLWTPLLLLVACAQILGIKSGKLHGACTTEAQCAPGYACRLGQCLFPCLEDAECEIGQRCLLSDDFDGCVETSMPCGAGCPGGTLCVADTCRTECSGPLECGGGQDCVAGTCVGASESSGGAGPNGASGAPPMLGGGGAAGSSPSQSGAGGAAEPGACQAGTYDHDGFPDTPCMNWADCEPGQRISLPGSATQNRQCVACTPESFTSMKNLDSCTTWQTCELGWRVSQAGTPIANRQCTPCEEGEMTTMLNQELCLGNGACAPGTRQTMPPMGEIPAVCAPCEAGTYCAGGDAEPVDCVVGLYNLDPASPCVPWIPCNAGTFASGGTPTQTQTCTPCGPRTFSANIDARSCMAWDDDCDGWLKGGLISEGTSMADAVCGPKSPFRLIGVTKTSSHEVAVDGSGNVYVVGGTSLAFEPPTPSAGLTDAYLRKLDPEGIELWTRQFGTANNDFAWDVALDGSGAVYVVGVTDAPTQGAEGADPSDAFLYKYGASGGLQWIRRFGTDQADTAAGVAVVGTSVYVAGLTAGLLQSGGTQAGFQDAYVRKYDTDGRVSWTRQFGSDDTDEAYAVAVDSDDHAYVVGYTYGDLEGTNPEAAGTNMGDVFIRKLNSNGDTAWTRQFGTAKNDLGKGVGVDETGNAYLVGWSDGGFGSNPVMDAQTGFLVKLDPDGGDLWTRVISSNLSADAADVSVTSDGTSYVTGNVQGVLDVQGVLGDASSGGSDIFLARFAVNGDVTWIEQIGTSGSDRGLGIALAPDNLVFVSGQTTGPLTGEAVFVDNSGFVGRFSPEN